MNKNYIAFVAARSAGHILPALALAHKAQEKDALDIIFFSSTCALDKQVLKNNKVITHHIMLPLDNVPSKIWSFIPYAWYCIKSFMIAFFTLIHFCPKKIISTGGYISFPVCFAAKLLAIPIELYELNAIPGKATLKLALLANKINCSFECARRFFPAYKSYLIRYPLYITSLQNPAKIMAALQFIPTKKILLVLGGSQGSRFINQFIAMYVKTNPHHIQIIHQTGIADFNMCKEIYSVHNISHHVFSYEKNIQQYYQIADLIVARAGAGILFEIIHFNKKALIIPLETEINNHQLYNAQEIAKYFPHLITILRQTDININSINFDQFFSSGH